jgi:DNA-binding transcriptional MerR regulator/methylmalonyl-CoA mutase cobalamin-binding subunit
MYTIKEASARTGVGVPLIRAWERRYGVVRPARTPSGYRLYDDAAVRVLLAMHALVETGWTPSEAARAIEAGEIDVDAVAGHAGAPPGGESAVERHRAGMIQRFVTAAAVASAADTEAALDEMLASGSFEAVIDDLVLPASAALGDAWAADRLSVAAEHAASAAVGRRLGAALQAAGMPRRTSVVVGLGPGARHELGALAFAVALRRRGVGVLYLGSDVPVDGWLDAVARTRARAAVIGAVTAAEATAAEPVVHALRSRAVPVLAMGGAGATDALTRRLGVRALPARVVDAAMEMDAALGRR